MKDWTWRKWVGKLSPIIAMLIATGIWEFAELPAPGWATIVSGLITFIVQQVLALIPEKTE